MITRESGGTLNMDLLPGPMTGAIEFTFSAMEAAEDALHQRYGGEEPRGAFLLLRPRYELFAGRASMLPHHFREVLERLDKGEDTRPGTAAECCVVLAEQSLRAPLRHEWFLAYTRAFANALGEEKARSVLKDIDHDLQGFERNPSAQEALEKTRQAVADPSRRLP